MFDGAKRPHTPETLFLAQSCDTCDAYERFNAIWLNTKGKTETSRLAKTVIKSIVWQWIGSFVLSLIAQLTHLISPLVLSDLTEFFTQDPADTEVSRGWGIGMCVLIICGVLVQSLTNHYAMLITQRLALRVRNCLQMMVYEKALCMRNADIEDQGKALNLISTDSQLFLDSLPIMNTAFASPIIIILSLVVLYSSIGWVGFVTAGITLVVLPLSGFVMTKIGKLMRVVQQRTDHRVGLMNEFIHAVRIIKYYVWEKPFIERIDKARNRELNEIMLFGVLRTLNVTIMVSAPMISLFVTFVIMAEIGMEITPGRIFTAFSVMNNLRIPFMMIGQFFAGFAQWKTSLQRISNFVSIKTFHQPPYVGQPPKSARIKKFANQDVKDQGGIELASVSDVCSSYGDPVVLSSATFAWPDGAPAIKDASLTIRHGEFVAVVGAVGSGKSALAQALLGELERVEGHHMINGSIAYVPQQPWILNRTFRDNIVFGQDWNEPVYNEVLRVSGLLPDLKVLPARDLTEIGERGINMSGGQKQRISIARAIYCNRDIMILDDPLSALDMHVGKFVMKEALLGFLKNKTRILMTNQLFLLPNVDRVIVLDHGSIMDASVKAVKKGERASPGELKGDFDLTRDSGTLYANTECGIFGKLSAEDAAKITGAALPIAKKDEIKTGRATILATVSGNETREYDIEIEKIYSPSGSTRNLLLRVTDEELLAQTGGVVQGMSGSAILQDGKIIGAVTHVLVNDPTQGYGILLEHMLDAADSPA